MMQKVFLDSFSSEKLEDSENPTLSKRERICDHFSAKKNAWR